MKYFLVFTHGESPEDYSVFYSDLVIAEDEKSAIQKYCEQDTEVTTADDFGDYAKYGIVEYIPIT